MYSLPTPLTQYALLSILMWNSSLNLNFYSSAFLRLSVAEWLACWTQTRRRRAWVQIVVATLAGNSLRQTVRTHRVSVHQAAKLVAALLRVVRVTAGLVESNGSLPPGLWFTSPAGWLPRTGISFGTLCSVFEYGLLLPFLRLFKIIYCNLGSFWYTCQLHWLRSVIYVVYNSPKPPKFIKTMTAQVGTGLRHLSPTI